MQPMSNDSKDGVPRGSPQLTAPSSSGSLLTAASSSGSLTMLASSPRQNKPRGGRQSPCTEAFARFRRCATGSGDTEGFSCSVAVASFARCALDQC